MYNIYFFGLKRTYIVLNKGRRKRDDIGPHIPIGMIFILGCHTYILLDRLCFLID